MVHLLHRLYGIDPLYLPKLIKIHANLTKFGQKQKWLIDWCTVFLRRGVLRMSCWLMNVDEWWWLCLVRLHHPPIITDGPHNQTVYVGDTVRLTCDLLSDPEYHLQWLKQLDEHIVIDNETRNFVVLHVSCYIWHCCVTSHCSAVLLLVTTIVSQCNTVVLSLLKGGMPGIAK